ncbi:MAG: hypothetical protein JNG84_11700 [Archangium sp.]|nr:hypothetical protein [Archangium sp.]
MALTGLVVAVLLGETLGPPVRHDGVTLRPPSGFRAARLDVFHGSRAGNVGGPGYVASALVDGDGEDAATMVLSIVEGPFSVGLGARDVLATAVVAHFRDVLEQPLALDRVEVIDGRVEVHGTLRDGGQARHVVISAFEGSARHLVVLVSVPTGRWQQLAPVIAASLESVRSDPQAPSPKALAGALLASTAALLAVSMAVWRQRRERLTARP